MTSFVTFDCLFEREACGACIGCQTRTIPGTVYFIGTNPFEARLLEELKPRRGALTMKGYKLRGMKTHTDLSFRALQPVVFHTQAAVEDDVSDDELPSGVVFDDAEELFVSNTPVPTFAQEPSTLDVEDDVISIDSPEERYARADYHYQARRDAFAEEMARKQRQEELEEKIFQATLHTRNASTIDQFSYLNDYVERVPDALGNGTKSLIGKYVTLGAIDDSVIDLLEIHVLFLYLMLRARNAADRMVAIVVLAKMMNTKLDIRLISVTALTTAFTFFCGSDESMDVQANVVPDFATMREFLDKYDMIKASPFFKKVYKFSMYGLGMSLFSPMGIDMDVLKFDKVAQEAVRKQYHLSPDFVHCALDTMLFLCERGYQAYRTGSVMPLFHSEEKYQAWFDKAEKLLRQSQFLSNPDVHGIDRFAFLADIKEAIELGQCMRKCALKKDEKLLLSRMLSSLELTHDLELTKRAAQRDRKSPLCLLLFGGSGIGKSTLENVVFQHYGKRRGLKTTSDFRYVRNPTEEFWSGMNSTQWCVVLDDIGYMNPALGVMDPSLAEMLCIANNVPFVPAQAELSDKGRTPVRAELVLGSTNTEMLNVAAYFACPLAVQRRFPWVIDVKVKPEYVNPDKPGMLDSARVPQLVEGEYPDLWEFTIKRVEPVGDERNRQKGKNVVHCECPDMRSFLKWMNGVMDNHNEIQDIIMQGNEIMERTLVCETCKLPCNWCECMTTQSSETTIATRPSYMEVAPLSFTAYSKSLTICDRVVVQYYLILVWFFTYSVFAWILNFFFGDFYVAKKIVESRHRWTLTRSVVSYTGYRVNHALGSNKRLTQVATGVVAALAAYKAGSHLFGEASFLHGMFKPVSRVAPVVSTTKSKRCTKPGCIHTYYDDDECTVVTDQVQGNVATMDKPRVNVTKYEDSGHDPVPQNTCRVRPTYEDPFPYSSDDLSQATLCASDGKMLMKHVEKATCVFQSRGDGKIRTVLATNVRGGVYMLNNHGIPAITPFHLDITCAVQGNMGTSMKQMLITESMVHRIPERDLAFIILRARPPGTDLTKYMCKEGFTGKLEGTYVGRDIVGEIWRRSIPVVKPELVSWASHDIIVQGEVWTGTTENPTMVGDCGAMLVSETPVGPVILGIHTLGRGGKIGAMKVPQSVAVAACDVLEPKFVARGSVNVSAPSAKRAVGNLDVQSSIRRANPGVADVKGSFTGEFRQRGRTNVTQTYIAPALLSFGYEVSRTKPDMSRTPWINALNDTTRPVVQIDNDILDAARDMYAAETCNVDLSGVHVYSLHVAINGCAGLDYCDKMNRKSSAGAPYKKSKKHFMYFLDETVSTDMDVVDEIKDTVYEMIATYQRGERCHPIYCGHLKDEPVTFEKAYAGKTRVFTASSMAYTLVVRKYLLSIIVLMQNNRYVFETGPGVVPQSLEWEQVREHVVQYGEDRLVAGDYSKFDKRMPANVILAAFDVIYSICERAGYTDADLKVVRGIAYDTAFPNVDFNGDLIEFFGSNPSGHPLTVIINGIVNSLYMRYCYLALRPITVSATFKERVALMTYGDDNIMGVHVDAPWFNHTAIQCVLANVDIGYTMADKEAVSVPYIHINETNFLKRTWRWDEDVGAYLAPLDRSSIEKMLMVCTAKKNISVKSHAISVISTALREYFFYGKDEFEQKTAIFWEVINKADLELYVEDSTFPTWEELKNAFWSNSEGIALRRLA